MTSIRRAPIGRSEARQLVGLLGRIAVIDFAIEVVIMMTFSGWTLTTEVVLWGLLDATLLTICAAPLVYIFAARPFALAAKEAQAALATELDARATQAARLEEALASLRCSMTQNEELQHRLRMANQKSAESNERSMQKIGADLHDGPAQLLSYALLRINKIAAEPSLAPAAAEDLRKMRGAVHDTLTEIRHISTGLAPPGLERATLKEAIFLAVAFHEEHTGTPVLAQIDVDRGRVSGLVKICAYRVVQEALTNAYRHGGGKSQRVKASCDGLLRISVSDGGPGFIPEQGFRTGLGLSGIKARVESLGGRLTIASRPGEGTDVSVEFDLAAQ